MAAPAAPVAPARLHSSSIPELSGNQRSPVAQRELVHVEFAGREVKLPGVLHSFLTVIKGMPAERGVRPNPLEPPLRTALQVNRQSMLNPFALSSRDGTSERRDTVFLRSPFTSGPSGHLATSMPTA